MWTIINNAKVVQDDSNPCQTGILVGDKVYPLGTGSGSGVDVTASASVGQTIVVEEVDANGKPTKWKAADYQPRTHWSEVVEVLPETTVEIDPDVGGGVIPTEPMFLDGKEYVITYNGVKYVCATTIITEDLEDDGKIDFTTVIMGNAGAVDENFPYTNDPFAIMHGAIDIQDFNNISYGWQIAPLDGSTSVTLSITEVKTTPIPVEYLSNAVPYYIEVSGVGTDENPYVCHDTAENVKNMYHMGRQLFVRNGVTDNTGVVVFYLPLVVFGSINGLREYGFAAKSPLGITDIILVLGEKSDGTFDVTSKTT